MMKAAIYYGKNDIRVEERETPAVGSNVQISLHRSIN